MGYSSDAIVEIIPTIQCEVPIGWPVILVRLRGCNCHCNFCDTKYSWIGKIINDESKTPQITDKDIDAVIEVHKKHPAINTILVTGGEPLLYRNQSNFYNLLNLEAWNFIQVETNGTLFNSDFLNDSNFNHHIMFHVSPKLNKNFYHDEDDFDNLIRRLAYLDYYCSRQNGYWGMDYLIKFVYSPDYEKIIQEFILKCGFLTNGSIHVMSRTPDINDFKDKNDFLTELRFRDFETIEFCMKYNYRFVPRFHMIQFLGDKTEMMDR